MLVIRNTQFETFRPELDREIALRLAGHLRWEHSQLPVRLPGGGFALIELPEVVLLEMICKGFEKARRHRLTWDSRLVDFVMLMFRVAPNFAEYPTINAFLRSDGADPDYRFPQLWTEIDDQSWQQARQQYDSGAWECDIPARLPEE